LRRSTAIPGGRRSQMAPVDQKARQIGRGTALKNANRHAGSSRWTGSNICERHVTDTVPVSAGEQWKSVGYCDPRRGLTRKLSAADLNLPTIQQPLWTARLRAKGPCFVAMQNENDITHRYLRRDFTASGRAMRQCRICEEVWKRIYPCLRRPSKAVSAIMTQLDEGAELVPARADCRRTSSSGK